MAKLSLKKIGNYVKKQTHGGLSLDGLKSSVKGAAKNPLTYAAGALLLPGVAPMALNAVKAGAGAVASGAGKLAGVAKAAIPKAVSSFLPHNAGGGLDLGGLLDTGLSVAQLVNAANLQKKSTGLATGAMDQVNTNYAERAPLRVAGLEGMLRPQTADLASLAQIAGQGNPFAPKKPLPAAPLPVRGY